MATHRWDDLKHKASPEKRAAIARAAKEEARRLEALEVDLKKLRQSLGLTQEELAQRLEMSQSQVSETEGREDMLISTLRRYVEALGGKLEVVANVHGKRIPLSAA